MFYLIFTIFFSQYKLFKRLLASWWYITQVGKLCSTAAVYLILVSVAYLVYPPNYVELTVYLIWDGYLGATT